MLRLEGVSFRYGDGSFGLHEIDIEVSKGEIVALVGPNGSGKTTLLKLMIGLLKPGRGVISLDGEPIHRLKEKEVFSRVGLVFQDPDDQIFLSTPEQDVRYGLVNRGLSAGEIEKRAGEALETVGISRKSSLPIQHLSHGERKRVALAGMLAMRPDYMLLDEPTNGLDPMGAHRFMETLVDLKRGGEMGIALATHDLDMAPVFCDRVVLLHRGKIICQGVPSEVFGEVSLVRAADLRLPRVAHLMEILSQKDGLGPGSLPLTIGQARKVIKNWSLRP